MRLAMWGAIWQCVSSCLCLALPFAVRISCHLFWLFATRLSMVAFTRVFDSAQSSVFTRVSFSDGSVLLFGLARQQASRVIKKKAKKQRAKASRVSPAVTRLTVYRRPQVTREAFCRARPKSNTDPSLKDTRVKTELFGNFRKFFGFFEKIEH